MSKAKPPPKAMGRPITTAARGRRATGELRPVTAWVDQSLWRKVRIHAATHDIRISDLVSCAIEKYLRTAVEQKGAS